MSCFVLSLRALSALADTTADLLNLGFNSFGFSAPRSLVDALEDCRRTSGPFRGEYDSSKIYNRFFRLNMAAYNGRYPADAGDLDDVPKMPDPPQLREVREYRDQHEVLKPWHYQLCKLIDSYIYQVEEDQTRDDPLTLALVDLVRVLRCFLVDNTAEYDAAKWGDI